MALLSTMAWAQANCESGAGPLHTERNVADERALIEKFAARETAAMAARRNFSFTQEVTIQTIRDMNRPNVVVVDGEFKQVVDVSYDDRGNRTERVTFAPQSSLRRISMTPSDLEDIRTFATFYLTSEELSRYEVRYLGQQHVDELDTYVFEVAPRSIEKNKRYFQGKLWVEMKDLDVVKSCGRSVPDAVIGKKKNARVDLHPTFATYREQMDGGYWFPTYSRADDYLAFARDDVHVREIIKFRNYQRVSRAGGAWQSFDDKNKKK